MGLKGGSKVLWKTIKMRMDLALKAIQKIASIEHERKQQQNIGGASGDDDAAVCQPRQCLHIPIDANLVGYKHIGNRSSFENVLDLS